MLIVLIVIANVGWCGLLVEIGSVIGVDTVFGKEQKND